MINFDGVDLLLDDPDGLVAKYVARHWSLPDSVINTAPRTIDTRSLCQVPNWPATPALKLNQLYIPSGATRWTRGLFLIDDAGLEEIGSDAHGVLTIGCGYPRLAASPTCAPSASSMAICSSSSLSSSQWLLGKTWSMIMFKLDPIPLTHIGAGGFYLLPLVDERYYWQGINIVTNATEWGGLPDSASLPTASTSSSSSSSAAKTANLFLDLAEALAADALGAPDPDDYISGKVTANGHPSFAAFRSGSIGAAAAMDLACWSQNLLLVPDDQTNVTYIPGVGNSQRYKLIGAGNSNSAATVSGFPCSASGAPSPRTMFNGQFATLTHPATPGSVVGNEKYGEQPAYDYPSKIKIAFVNPDDLAQSEYTAITPAPTWIPIKGGGVMSLKALSSADELTAASASSSSASSSSVPGNKAELDAIAKNWSYNWWANMMIQFDWVLNNMPIIKFVGLEDYVLFDMALKRGGGGYSCNTRWVSLPPSFGYEYIAIETTANKNRTPVSPTTTVTSTGCGCCQCYDCLADQQATVGGCDDAPDGAAYQYQILIGNWTTHPELAPNGRILLTFFSPTNCGTSSSSGSSASSSGTGCMWYSCPISVTCDQSSSSSSSTASSSSGNPVYQWQAKIYTDPYGLPAFKCIPVLLSGVDCLGIEEEW